MQRMGIADAMKAKIVYRTQGSEVADAVAKGEAELGISFTSELQPNKGVKVAGTLPAAIQLPTIYSAAIAVYGRERRRGARLPAYARRRRGPCGAHESRPRAARSGALNATAVQVHALCLLMRSHGGKLGPSRRRAMPRPRWWAPRAYSGTRPGRHRQQRIDFPA